MLEGLVAALLNRFLGMYIRNFDPKQLNVGIWSGDVKLRNLELRQEALDQLKLPINVVEGHLGFLTLSIPWSNLKGKPVKVFIEDVFLLAAPKEDAEYDEAEEERRRQAVKLEKLDSAEMLKERSGEGLSQEEQQKNQSFTDSLVTKIVDNLQVTVKNIHVRYEDSVSAPGHPFALGLTLQEFSAVSTDGEWNPTFIQTSSGVTHKLATLGALAIYWNTDSNLIGTGKGTAIGSKAQGITHNEMMEQFQKLIIKNDDDTPLDHQFILKPVSGRARVELDKTGRIDRPKTRATLLFDEIGFILDDDQYRDALMMIDLFHYFVRHQEYKKYQPKGVTPKEDPRAWLKFAGDAVLSKIHDRNRRWTWEFFKERRDDRVRYIDLFKKKKKEAQMSAAETEDFNALEQKLAYEDLRFWRSLARNQLRKENAAIKKVAPAKQSGGWTSWIWGSGKPADTGEEPTEMNEQQRKELYEAIDWDEKTAIAESVDLPRETIKLQLDATLKTGSFALKREPHGKNFEVVSLLFDNFQAKVLQRPDSFMADLRLGGLRVYEGTTEGSLYPQIVRVKDGVVSGKDRITEVDDDAEDPTVDEVADQPQGDPFFHLQFEQHPLDNSADSAVTMKLKGMEVIYNPQTIVGVVEFFRPPERHMESIGALMESASATVEGIRQQTRAGLEFALQEHRTINAQLDLQAPLIIIPESITSEDTNCLIFDAGHVSMNSELIDKATIREIQAKQKQQYSEEDFKQLERLMYDKFLLKLESTQVLIGPSVQATRAQLESGNDVKHYHIVDRINIDFVVEISILPKAPNLTKFRVSGHLPVLHASISDAKYKNLMRIIDVAIPKTSQGTGSEAPVVEPPHGPTPEQKHASSTAERRRSRAVSTSFQFSAQENKIILEADDSDVEGEDKFEEANEGSSGDQVELHQRNFEIKFTVGRLQGSLFKASNEEGRPDQLLVDLIAEQFMFDFYLRPFDMIAEVSLQALSVEDHIEEDPTPEFKQIVSSKGFESDDRGDLLHVKFSRVNKDSPEYMSVYEGIEMNVDVSISTINLVVTRKTLLTLLDFILITFATPNQPQSPSQTTKEDNHKITESGETAAEESATSDQPKDVSKLRVKIELRSIIMILNNDGIRLATLSLNTADTGIFLMGKTMRIGARLGSLSLVDDINQGATADSSFRQLVAIQGDELADFRYETFDAAQPDNYPGYDSAIYLRSGSIQVNFVEEPFRKIIDFMVKFGKMQAIFNAARQAAMNQANSIQENANKMHFDILIRTPILIFPRISPLNKPKRDLVTANLGEIYASNAFVPLEDTSGSLLANKLSVGVRNVRLTSHFHFENDRSEELEIIDRAEVGFKIVYLEHQRDMKRPDMEIQGFLSDVSLRITQPQIKFLVGLSKSVPAALSPASDDDEQILSELPSSTVEPAKAMTSGTETPDQPTGTRLGPELGVPEGNWTKVDLIFSLNKVGLELVAEKNGEPVGSIEDNSLSIFSLNNTNVKLRMISDGSIESELLIQSFTIRDSRSREINKFRKIMSSTNKEAQQFMASITLSGGKEKNLIALLTIDSPRVIFALDYLFAVQDFINEGLSADEPLQIGDDSENTSEDPKESEVGDSAQSLKPPKQLEAGPPGNPLEPAPDLGDEEGKMNVSFRINIVDAQVALIANPTVTNSEAIVLQTTEVLLSQQNSTTLQVSNVGMFLCRMDRFDTSRLRILDDFTLQFSMDSRSSSPNSFLTSIHLDLEPLVLRLSLRDILLALQIINKASELSGREEKPVKDTEAQKIKDLKGDSGPKKTKSASHRALSTTATKTARTVSTAKSSGGQGHGRAPSQSIMKREELTAEIEGLRVILIGDLHELPLLDWSVRHFTVGIRDWSGQMNGDTNMDTFINIYNFSKSAWEPLIEPWELGFHMSKDQSPDRLSVELYSRKMLEVTVTTASIALASKSAHFLSQEGDVLSKPRGVDAPYRLRNYTGFDVNVWADAPDEDDPMALKLTDGEEKPWRFEDQERMRENLSPEGNSGMIGLRLEGSGFESLNRIPVNREGENIYTLRPRQDKILHRLLVEVRLEADNVKYIILRSPLLVQNNTQIPVELGIFDHDKGHLLKIEKIAPEESRPAPVGAAFMHSVLIRPDQGFGYQWSNERLYWKDLLKRPTRTLSCKGEGADKNPAFFFQMSANFDKSNPLTSIYPYMRICLSAPLELHNLLPYDFKYRIYDKNTRKDWTNFLRKGGLSPVHVVELSHLLLMSIDMQDTVFKQSEFAIINSSNQEDFKREHTLVAKDDQGLALNLKLHFFDKPDSGGAFRVAVYSPYVILNKTGLDVNIKSKTLLQSAKSAAGQGVQTGSQETDRKALPYMFSYPTDDRQNRAILRIGDSNWSKPQSLDAIGSDVEVVLPSASRQSEIHAGISVTEGEGKYKMSKVITLAPRYIVKNKIAEEISIREPGSSNVMSLQPDELCPLHFLRQGAQKQLCLCFPGLDNKWSSPFDISNIGSVHVKLAKSRQPHRLIRVDVLLEHATIFLHLSVESKHWPYSMRNESDTEFMFYQSNPNLDEGDSDDNSRFRPISYRLPPRSIMPYAWDYPAAKYKELVITCNGKERPIKLAEIGNLIPMRVPVAPGSKQTKIIDVNVAADGPTQTLVLSNYKQSKSLYKQKSNTSSQASVATGFEVKDMDTDVTFKAQVRLAGIGISFINKQLKEMIYVTFRDIEVKYNESPLYQTVNFTIKWIQVDNQLYGGIYPLILYPSVVPKTGKEMDVHPIFHAMVTRVKDDSYGVLYIKYATLLLQQMTLEIDEDLIFALLDFSKIPGASWSEEHEGTLCDDEMDIPEPQQEQQGQDVYFELLHLQPAQLDLSFMRTERINVEDKTSSSNPLLFFLNVMTMAIGNVNDAPVRLNALMLENARVSIPVLTQHVQNHYSQEFLYQVHKILGSADFLGNPVGLFNNISSGVADIFYEPYQGFVMSDRPQELGIGIAKGATSFVKKSVFGVSDSISKWSGSMSKGLAAATMDKQFQDRRRMTRSRNRPKHALYGVTAGANSFVTSVASGFGGLVQKPLEGAERGGVPGLFKGVGKGFLGLATKPAIGVFDLASNVTEGIRNTTTVFDAEGLDRVRLTRFIGTDGVVRPYSQREALGQFWLKQLDSGKYFNEEYIAHLELPREDVVVMLTYNRIMLIKSKKLGSEWDVPLRDILRISKEKTGLSITLRGNIAGPFIPVDDSSSRDFLYKRIGVAVNAFNDKYRATE